MNCFCEHKAIQLKVSPTSGSEVARQLEKPVRWHPSGAVQALGTIKQVINPDRSSRATFNIVLYFQLGHDSTVDPSMHRFGSESRKSNVVKMLLRSLAVPP